MQNFKPFGGAVASEVQTSTNWVILAYLAAFLSKISTLFLIVTQLSPSAPDLS